MHLQSHTWWPICCGFIRAARVKGSRWIEFDKEYHMKSAAWGNRKWLVHNADLWDHYITTAATLHSQEGSVGEVHAHDRMQGRGSKASPEWGRSL